MIDSYNSCINYLYEQLPAFHRIGAAAYKDNLDNTIALSKLLDHPELKFPTIHIAGTNGKGSVSNMLASVLQEAGFKVGLFTSPHLKDFRERIRVNGEKIPKRDIVDIISYYIEEFDKIDPSFFELTFAMGMFYFALQNVDIAIVEAGLGGRLDSTNIIQPKLSIITNISNDHMQYLGDTLPKIAAEKAGIIKQNVPVLIGKSQEETNKVFIETAKQHNSEIVFADKIYKVTEFQFSYGKPFGSVYSMVKNGTIFYRDLYSPLSGEYQRENLPTVFAAVDMLNKHGYDIPRSALHEGISNTIINTGLRGRFQILSRHPMTIVDIAHNEAGIKIVMEQIKKMTDRLGLEKLHFVLGMVNDKDYKKMLSLLPTKATYYFCKANIPRGLDANILAEEAGKFKLKGTVYPTVKEAYRAANSLAAELDIVLVCGSAFVVAEVDRYRESKKMNG